MDLKTQIIAEYLTQGSGFRKLAAKYGISRTTICKWVAIELPNTGGSSYTKRTANKKMEKLLSTTKKQGDHCANNVTANTQKIFPLAIRATKIFFCHTL